MIIVPALDLFSGIGGFTKALADATPGSSIVTVGYCDVDPDCRSVLRDNMSRDLLPIAPVYEDVRTLGRETLDPHAPPPVLITAGFPCQDIAASNSTNAKGITGPRSRLFFEVTRIAKELPSVQYVFLENSSCIRTRGLDILIRELRTAGFDRIVHGTFSSKDVVGTLHGRRRWFCIARRPPTGTATSVDLPALPAVNAKFDATAMERIDRLVPKRTETARALLRRSELLGNSVVPQMVAWVYEHLRHVLARDDGGVIVVPSPVPPLVSPRPVNLVILDSDDAQRVFATRSSWSTPTVVRLNQHRLTERSVRLFATQAYNERRTWERIRREHPSLALEKPHDLRLHFVLNPEFTEAIMGYPIGWTRAAKLTSVDNR